MYTHEVFTALAYYKKWPYINEIPTNTHYLVKLYIELLCKSIQK